MAAKIRKLVHFLVALLLVGLFVGSVEAGSGIFIIGPSDEAIEKVQLSPPDSVVGNMSVSNGFVDFYVTNPSYDIVYQSQKTSFDSFNFIANESGTYVMHFANKYQSEDVNVTLSYACNIFVVASVTIGVSASSSGTATITRVQQYLILDVSPLAFPVVGQFWKLSVFYQIKSSDGIPHYSPLPNATVEITIIVDGQKKVYSYTSDALGHLEFQFLAEYSDISFQAVSGENRSDIIALTQRSEHYVRVDFVNLISQLSILMLTMASASEAILIRFRKRIRTTFNLLIGAVLCYSLIQLVISVYAQVNSWTQWGYLATIFGFVPWTFMGYASVVGIIVCVILTGIAYKLGNPKVVVPLK